MTAVAVTSSVEAWIPRPGSDREWPELSLQAPLLVVTMLGTMQLVIRQAGGVASKISWDPSPARLSAQDREDIRRGLGVLLW